ncbi:MAG: aspartate aminotransferase family protein [Chromatiales bacterium]|nr:aspartate aminotransferase family protein [Chromatiales bacterium]
MDKLLEATSRAAVAYLDSLDSRPVFPTPADIEKVRTLDGPMPAQGLDAQAVLEELDTYGSPATVASAGGRYFGFVTGGTLPAALAANWLAGTWDQNAFSDVSSPAATTIESIAARWILEVLGLPRSSAVAFVTGATMANFTCLAAARGAQLRRLGWDVEADGLFGAPALDVVVSEESHAVVYKALGFLGLGRQRVRTIPADCQGRLRLDKVGELSEASIVCLQAGNVNSGSFDPLEQVCEAAQTAGAWVHVDGAFGLWANAAESTRHLVSGIEKANSWATDGHKWLNVPYDCGVAVVTEIESLRRAVAMTAAYLPDSEGRQPIDFTPESSRRARGVEVWAALRSLGRSGVAELIERNCRFARRFAAIVGEAGIEVLNDVCLNQVVLAFGDKERTARVLEKIQQDGTFWCGGTRWQGRDAARISVSSWATTEVDIERSATRMVEIAAEH